MPASPPRISILVPAYEMSGLGGGMLRRLLNSINVQNLSQVGTIEIVVSDHSTDDLIRDVCREFLPSRFVTLTYLRKTWQRDNPSSSLNYAFKASKGELIKILFLDDFLMGPSSLQVISKAFEDQNTNWIACGTIHTSDGHRFFRPHVPYFHPDIQFGRNTISSPSVVTLRRTYWQQFDENLFWMMDVDFYKRMSLSAGEPKIVPELLVATTVGPHQATRALISRRAKVVEHLYVIRKYATDVGIVAQLIRRLRVFGLRSLNFVRRRLVAKIKS